MIKYESLFNNYDIPDSEKVIYNDINYQRLETDGKYIELDPPAFSCSEDDVVIIDKEIYDTIKTFNRKGYKTLFCCAGHIAVSELIYDRDNVDLLERFSIDDLFELFNYLLPDTLYISFDMEGYDKDTANRIASKFAKLSMENPILKMQILHSYDPEEDNSGIRIIHIEYDDMEFDKFRSSVWNLRDNKFFDNLLDNDSIENKKFIRDQIVDYIKEVYEYYYRDTEKARYILADFANGLATIKGGE